MNAAIERADAFLAEAKHGIDTGTLTTAEIEDYIATAGRILAQVKAEARTDILAQAGKQALASLDYLEEVRRLCVYGVAHGRLGREAMQFCELMKTRPPVQPARGINGLTPSFEWLRANRADLSNLIQNLQPASQL